MSDLISRQAAIAAMTNYFARWTEYTAWSKTIKAMVETAQEAAREMLTELPSEQVRTQMSSAELISRKAAIDALGEKPLAWTESEYELGLQNQWQSDVDALKDLPSAKPDRRRGRWEWHNVLYDFVCTACGRAADHDVIKGHEYEPPAYEYCPHCGARMEER